MNKKDPFNFETCINTLFLNATAIHSQFYDICYQLTFKKSFKEYADHFKVDDDECLIPDIVFFEDISDPFVQHAYKGILLGIDLVEDFRLRYGISPTDCLTNTYFCTEAGRYAPYMAPYLETKSYAQLLFLLSCFYDSTSLSLYYYACALTLNSYNIPLEMKVKLDYSLKGSFRMLNLENTDVNVLVQAIFDFEAAKQELNKTIYQLDPYISCPKI